MTESIGAQIARIDLTLELLIWESRYPNDFRARLLARLRQELKERTEAGIMLADDPFQEAILKLQSSSAHLVRRPYLKRETSTMISRRLHRPKR